jgi:hypothetical protein
LQDPRAAWYFFVSFRASTGAAVSATDKTSWKLLLLQSILLITVTLPARAGIVPAAAMVETMEEAFFVESFHMRKLMLDWNRDHPRAGQMNFPGNPVFEEVALSPTAEDAVDRSFNFFFLHNHPEFTLNDLRELAIRKIVWMGPDLFFNAKGNGIGVTDFCRCFGFGRPILTIGMPIRPNGGHNELEVYYRPTPTNGRVDVFQLMTRVIFYFYKCIGYRPKIDLYSISHETTWNNEPTVEPRIVTPAATTICEYVIKLMKKSNTKWTDLDFDVLPSVSAGVLRSFLENPRVTSGGVIRFGWHYDLIVFSDTYLRVFRDNAGPHHQLELNIGTTGGKWKQKQIEIVAKFFMECKCAISLRCGKFEVHAPLINDALRGRCNLVDLVLHKATTNVDGLVEALGSRPSKLLRLTFLNTLISEASWTVLCRSLARQSTLVFLCLHRTFPHEPAHTFTEMMAMKARRTGAFLLMLQTNTTLQELDARGGSSDPQDEFEFDERTLSDVILPCLRVRALAGTGPTLDLFVALRTVHTSMPGFQQGNEEEDMVPNA